MIEGVESVFGEMIVLQRIKGRVLPITAAEAVTKALRGAAMKHCGDPVPELLSGHQPGGSASQAPHGVQYPPLDDDVLRRAFPHVCR